MNRFFLALFLAPLLFTHMKMMLANEHDNMSHYVNFTNVNFIFHTPCVKDKRALGKYILL